MTTLILTIGSGTQTKSGQSDLAQGLLNTLRKVAPDRFWLIPSADPESTFNADFVRENAPAAMRFMPWSARQPYRNIDHHDDLSECRTAIKEVLQKARQGLSPSDRLLVNPTSGTKQMSVGAVLAALDEEVGMLIFTVGDRADGVVKTGTERMAEVNTAEFFLERDLAQADALFQTGAYLAAGKLLERHGARALHSIRKALCLHEWQRMNYSAAAGHAAVFSQALRDHLSELSTSDSFGEQILADLFVGADDLHRWGDHEEALARFYRAAEQTAKVRLAQEHSLRPPYLLHAVLALIPQRLPLEREILSRAHGNDLSLGNDLAWRILGAANDPMAADYLRNPRLKRGLQLRNESIYGHDRTPVDEAQVQVIMEVLRELLNQHLPVAFRNWTQSPKPRSLR